MSRFADVIRAEIHEEDLVDSEYEPEIVVRAMRRDKSLYVIGYVSASLVYQNPSEAHRAIEMIKFPLGAVGRRDRFLAALANKKKERAVSETENKWEAAMRLLARFVLDDDRERARCGMNGITLFHVEEARALLASVKVGGGDPHPLATENARLRSALAAVVAVADRKTVEFDAARALLAGKPLPPAPQPDAVKVLREACEAALRTLTGESLGGAISSEIKLRAALAATEGV